MPPETQGQVTFEGPNKQTRLAFCKIVGREIRIEYDFWKVFGWIEDAHKQSGDWEKVRELFGKAMEDMRTRAK